jgi:hypothetical protein
MTHHKESGPPSEEHAAAVRRKDRATFLKASGTGAAHAQTGAVAISGIVYGDVQVGTQPAPRSGYGVQVRRIVPEVLVGRGWNFESWRYSNRESGSRRTATSSGQLMSS